MLYMVANSRIVEAPDYSGILECLRNGDYDLPFPKSKLQYKYRVVKRMGKNFTNCIKTDKQFIDYLINEDILQQMERVFVYGTLKEGYGNHRILEHCIKYKEGNVELKGLNLYEWTQNPSFPFALTGNENDIIHCETYLVNDDIMVNLDALEGNPHFYKRELIVSEDGRLGWVYVYQGNKSGLKRLDNGNWIGYNYK